MRTRLHSRVQPFTRVWLAAICRMHPLGIRTRLRSRALPFTRVRLAHVWCLYAFIQFVLLTLAVPSWSDSRNVTALPNLILISLDSARPDHLSLYGYPLSTSPNLDNWASRALVFDHARTVVPLTGPSHASVFTSLYPHQHGAFRNGVPLKERWHTLAKILSDRGYHTAAFISGWTLRSTISGLNRGFLEYDDDLSSRYKLLNRERVAEDTVAAVLDFLGQKPFEAPFFLFVHFFDPHDPYRRHAGIVQVLENQARRLGLPKDISVLNYDNELAYLDLHLGKLLETCQRRGMLENTLVMIFSDHGESLGEHGYRGHGRRIYEQCVRIPMLLYAPQLFPQARRVATPVTTLDILPTMLSLMGIPLPAGIAVAGRDLAGHLLTGEPMPARPLYSETFKGTLKRFTRFFARGVPSKPSYMGCLSGTLKFILKPDASILEVYDLAADPDEQRNLACGKSYSEVSTQLASWYEERLEREPIRASLTTEETQQLRSLGYLE